MPEDNTKYDIKVMCDDERVDFDLPAPSEENVTRFGYLVPVDDRCVRGVVSEQTALNAALQPVLGSTYADAELNVQVVKQVTVALHDVTILGYIKEDVIDPRITARVATIWEVYLDNRIFSSSGDADWQDMMGRLIQYEQDNPTADAELVDDMQQRLLKQVNKKVGRFTL